MRNALLKVIIILFAFYCIPGNAAFSSAEKSRRPRTTTLFALPDTGGDKDEKPDTGKDIGWTEPPGLDDWYFRFGASAGYYRMGPEIERALQQIEDFFSGKEVRMSALNFDTTMTMKSSNQVKRAETAVLPMTELGFGYGRKKSRIELTLGIAGMATLNTINEDSPMTIHEDATGDIDDRPMAKLGFVNEFTGIGHYRLQVVMNEEVWIVSPSLVYDYIYYSGSMGLLSVGTGVSLMILTVKQDLEFRAERTDVSGSPLSERVLEGSLQSTAVNDMGPRVQLHLGYRKRITEMMEIDFRLGVSAGYVDVHRDVDGASTIFMGGDALPVSFPLSSVTVGGQPVKSRETNRIELMGIFIQAGISI